MTDQWVMDPLTNNPCNQLNNPCSVPLIHNGYMHSQVTNLANDSFTNVFTYSANNSFTSGYTHSLMTDSQLDIHSPMSHDPNGFVQIGFGLF